jgi:diaminopimelate decarboxylase
MKPYFTYQNGELFVEQVALTDIADQYDTPCYVYSRLAIENNWNSFNKAFENFPHQICYAVKANSNIAILNLLAKLGSGFDIVSLGELERVLAAGGDANKIVFSGVGKKTAEIIRALEVGIHCFNVESQEELERINILAKQSNTIAKIALRINPNIDAGTHPYIATGMKENKFGIAIENALPICLSLNQYPNLKLIGIACHLGSQLLELNPFLEAADRLLELSQAMQKNNIHLQHINIGGGIGVTYLDEHPPSIKNYAGLIRDKFNNFPYEIIMEPGRAIVANAGILLTRVEYLKQTEHKNFAIVDAAMNDLIRPALYDAWQNIIPVSLHSKATMKVYDVVGPVCESADFLGKKRDLALNAGDLLAICTAGAYGYSMCSTYNSRPRLAEIMVDDTKTHLIRKRETTLALFADEKIIS